MLLQKFQDVSLSRLKSAAFLTLACYSAKNTATTITRPLPRIFWCGRGASLVSGAEHSEHGFTHDGTCKCVHIFVHTCMLSIEKWLC